MNLASEHRDDARRHSRYCETNVLGATNARNAARLPGIKKLVFTSSAAVYSFQPTAVDENDLFKPFNECKKIKLAAEQVSCELAREDSPRTMVIVRPPVVFRDKNHANLYLLRRFVTGRFFMVGTEDSVKCMTYVHNIGSFLERCPSVGPEERIFNYVDGLGMTTREPAACGNEFVTMNAASWI